MKEIKSKLLSQEYDFLRNNSYFGNQIIMLGISGSNSYGTNIDGSDLDIRGISLELPQDLLLLKESRNIADNHTDTTIYQFNSFIKLLVKGQPNMIEMLGLRKEDYLYKNYIFDELLKNKEMFLSQHILHRIKGYTESEYKKSCNIGEKKKKYKSWMHIIRLYSFGYEIANGNIFTYREKEKSLLLNIRKGIFNKEEFEEILRIYREKFEIAANNSKIPYDPDLQKIKEFQMKVNKRNICGCI